MLDYNHLIRRCDVAVQQLFDGKPFRTRTEWDRFRFSNMQAALYTRWHREDPIRRHVVDTINGDLIYEAPEEVEGLPIEDPSAEQVQELRLDEATVRNILDQHRTIETEVLRPRGGDPDAERGEDGKGV